ANYYEPHRAVSNSYEEEITETNFVGTKFTRIRRHKGLYEAARASSPRLRGVSDHILGHFLRAKGATPDWPERRRRWSFPSVGQCRGAAWQEYREREGEEGSATDGEAEPIEPKE